MEGLIEEEEDNHVKTGWRKQHRPEDMDTEINDADPDLRRAEMCPSVFWRPQQEQFSWRHRDGRWSGYEAGRRGLVGDSPG